jgi:hypothetical protein
MINYQLWVRKVAYFLTHPFFTHTKSQQQQQGVRQHQKHQSIFQKTSQESLVGGLEHGFYDFPFSRDFHHPNLHFTVTPSFVRLGFCSKPPKADIIDTPYYSRSLTI